MNFLVQPENFISARFCFAHLYLAMRKRRYSNPGVSVLHAVGDRYNLTPLYSSVIVIDIVRIPCRQDTSCRLCKTLRARE